MLRTNFRGLSQKSLTILLALGLAGRRCRGAIGRQANQRPRHDGANYAAGCVQPGRYQFGQ